MKPKSTIGLHGLRYGSHQVLGAIRLVPLLRDGAPGDLRIAERSYGDVPTVVSLDGELSAPGIKYVSYVPHGLVVSHTKDGSAATFGTTLGDRKNGNLPKRCVKLLHRMVKQEDAAGGERRFRFLPLHLAMEGFLALHFDGPDVLWSEYSRHAISRGLDPRCERAVRGAWLPGFEEALRVFEISPQQVGMMVFVADALAAISVVSHPDDYQRMHRSLIEDFFGELVYEYAILHGDAAYAGQGVTLDAARVRDLADLRREVARATADFDAYSNLLVDGLFGRSVAVDTVRDSAPFRLERFLPELDPDTECHIGERIVRRDGTVEYMKTFRLSAAQVRRAYLLERLADAQWNLERAAARMKCTKDSLVARLVGAGFGYLLRPHVLAAAELSVVSGAYR